MYPEVLPHLPNLHSVFPYVRFICPEAGREVARNALLAGHRGTSTFNRHKEGTVVTQQAQHESQETSDGATSKAQEVATQAKEQVQEKAGEVKGRASDRLREQLESHSTRVAEQISPFPDALRKAAESLESQGSGPAAKAVARAADRAEQLASYLEGADSDRILGDVETFTRRRPWVVAGIGTTVGFVAARFLTASSERRYDGRLAQQQQRLEGSAPAGTELDEESGLPRALSESSYSGH
jgi:ElaB/YqjD/DUF883 family membrane-anchored ribosome-binding protein